MSNHVSQWLRMGGVWLLGVLAILYSFYPATAQATGSDFNIQVAPSPLTITLTPGQMQSTSLVVRNFSSHDETLRPSLSGFRIDSVSQKITLLSAPPANMANWVHFKQSDLTLAPGTGKNLDIIFDTPKDVGFSYAAAITLTRANTVARADATNLRGAVAVFCLANINRPDAKSAVAITSLSSDKSSYEFLPATFHLSLKNTGNVISQPTGTIFIQRSFSDATPIASLPINSTGGYVLPDTTRSFSSSWQNGFPAYVANPALSGQSATNHLNWNWSHLSQLRFGRYVAKAVIIYNDGHSDVPVIASTSFWVIPWRLIGFGLLLLIVLGTGLYAWGRFAFKSVQKVQRRGHK